MLKIKFIVVDRTRSPFLKKGELFFLDRLQNYTRVKWIEIKPVRINKGVTSEEIINKEGEAVALKLSKTDYVVALDRKGHHFNSKAMAGWLNSLSTYLRGWICFVIGGPLGLSNEILDRADNSLLGVVDYQPFALTPFTLDVPEF